VAGLPSRAARRAGRPAKPIVVLTGQWFVFSGSRLDFVSDAVARATDRVTAVECDGQHPTQDTRIRPAGGTRCPTPKDSLSVQLTPPQWHFLPAHFAAGDLEQVETRFAELAARPVRTTAELERWLRDESELLSKIEAEAARRYIAKSRDTTDAVARAAHQHMEDTVLPRKKVLADALDRKFVTCAERLGLDPDRFATILRRRRTRIDIFHPENPELQRQDADLQTRQQVLVGGIRCEFDGAPRTLQQMALYQEQQDRSLRERAWRTALTARRAHWPELEDLYDRMVTLRTTTARHAGFSTYTPYRFLELGRYDYSEATCRQFHDAVAEGVVPAVRELDQARARRLDLQRLRPWDLEVDAEGHAPMRPFATEAELVALGRTLFARVDTGFAELFDALAAHGMLDLMNRPGKAPGGFQCQLEDVRLPFVFANGVGTHADVQTLLHEGGHAFHSLLCRDLDLLDFRDYPIEIAETASMSMELFGLEHLAATYAAADAGRARRKHLEGLLRTLTWIASIDAFQHWVYGRPQHSHDERRTAWLDIHRRFGGDVDWTGLDDALAMRWIGQSHLFGHPFYYIEYGIAQLAALQLWQRYRRAPAKAVADYRRALALGGSRPLPDLFAAAGVRFDLSPTMVRELVDDVMAQLRSAPNSRG
jgi:oligoendopeptidase F